MINAEASEDKVIFANRPVSPTKMRCRDAGPPGCPGCQDDCGGRSLSPVSRDRIPTMVRALFGLLLFLCPRADGAISSSQTGTPAAGGPEDPSLEERLGQVLSAPVLVRSSWGVQVQSLDTGKILFSENPEKRLIPASNLKLLTAVAAVEDLGPDFRFTTRIWTDGRIEDGTLEGNLIIQGGADPTLGARFYSPDPERMEEGDPVGVFRKWRENLRKLGIQRIRGRLLADDSLLAAEGPGRGWSWDDLVYGYGAVPSGLQYNEGVALVRVSPTVTGAPAHLLWRPPTPLIRLRNRTRTGPRQELELKWPSLGEEIVLEGAVDPSQDPVWLSVAVRDPVRYFTGTFAEFLRASHLELMGHREGEHGHGHPGESRTELFSHDSPPLSQVLRVFLKISQNLYGETLVRMLDPSSRGKRGAAGLMRMESILEHRIGLDPDSFLLADGSGLSRHNLISAGAMLRLLEYVHRQSYGSAFRQWLPVAGTDGTLRRRMIGPGLKGRVQAKTGSMEGVRALSGFLETLHGETLVFAMLVNHLRQDEADLRALQEEFLQVLVNVPGTGTSPSPPQ